MAALPSIVQGLDAYPSTWQVPPELLRLRGIRRDPLLCYILLWQVAGCRPGRLTVDYLRLQATMAASEPGVRRWLATLEKAGLIDILGRQPRQAEIRVRDWRLPRAADAPPKAGVENRASQLALPFAAGADHVPNAGPATISIWTALDRHPRSSPRDRPTAG